MLECSTFCQLLFAVDQEEQKVESTGATTHQKPIINLKPDKDSEKDRVVTLLNKAKEVAKEVKRTKNILSHELSVVSLHFPILEEFMFSSTALFVVLTVYECRRNL